MAASIPIYLEIGAKRTFAGALDWPGWSRSGKDETTALQNLLDYAGRYEAVLKLNDIGFTIPLELSQFKIIERLKGGATTDFGTPGTVPSQDQRTMNEAELDRSLGLLRAFWSAFDKTVKKATGRILTTGPRGGGRDLERIVQHVVGGDDAYLRSIGWKPVVATSETLEKQLDQIRREVVAGLTACAHGELPAKGPRGGIRWKPRYFVRRSGWHVLDHAWEIEDRIVR
ncbi:MAG: hypothetical protein A2Y54_09655 [Chloroflexi bacterium RBG_16_51_16]|nr:MAG: hypothetical protein A2Y54_09655 [Chloroflexi bacterium RBG_16_51_16]